MIFENITDNIPIVTKIYILASLALTLATYIFNIPPEMYLFHSRLFFCYGQYWRIITTFLYFGPFSLDLFFHGFFFIKYFKALESGKYHNRTADFIYMIIFGAIMLIILGSIFNVHLLGTAIMFMYSYIWSRYNSNLQMSFFGMIEFNALALPWMLLGFQYLTTGVWPTGDFLGIIVGHTYYYLNDVFPITHNYNPLETPVLLKKLFFEDKESDTRRRRYLRTGAYIKK